MRTLLGKFRSAIYVNKSPNPLRGYSGPASIYLQKTKLTLYFSLIYPYVIYCNYMAVYIGY